MIKDNIILEAVVYDNASRVIKTISSNLEQLKGGFDKVTTVTRQQSKNGEILKQTMVKTTPTIKRFKMEWLSVMFAGMALNRTFSGIIKNQMDLWGVTDTLSSMWTITMLDTMEQVSEKLIDIMMDIMDFPDEVKTIISISVLGLSGIGSVLALIGQATLGVEGIKKAFKELIPAMGVFFGKIKAFVLGLSSSIWLIVGIIVAIIIGMVMAWKENFMNMKKIVQDFIDSVKLIFKSLIDIFSGALDIIKGLLAGDVDLIKEGFVKILKGFANLLIGIVNLILSSIMAITVGVVRIIAGIIQSVINIIIDVANAISSFFGGKSVVKRVDIVGWLSKLDATPPQIPSFKEGGIMPYTGLAQLHAGERIIPTNESIPYNYSPNITVNATISNDYDVRKLADEINKYLVDKYNTSTKMRS